MKIKDKDNPKGFKTEKIVIQLTKRGPVVSNVIKGLDKEKVITVRWSAWESMQPSTGMDYLLKAKSVKDVKNILKDVTIIGLNFVFADIHGDIAFQTSCRIPIRSKGNGSIPFKVTDGRDNWSGWIPYDEMPQKYQAEKGWVGTANHNVITKDYPYYYSSWFATSYRYQRMTELLDPPGIKTVDDHWNFQQDDLNVLSRSIFPVIAKALISQEETRKMGEILNNWDFRDQIDSPAPSIFQETYRNLVKQVFIDELGEEVGSFFLGNNYFWQERLGKMIKDGESDWFDNISTQDKKETLTDLIQMAGMDTLKDLSERIGKDPKDWLWGKIHQIEFLNPVRRSGLGKGFLGGGIHPMAGSGDTIYRALFPLNHKDNLVEGSAAARMVMDLSDQEKVVAVIPGGVDGRTFSPHFTDQVEAYMSGEKMYWWFSDEKIKENAVSELLFIP
ncbi:MAG: penicillin acylase family protein [Desulfobacteraceae bacterium]|nr:penicillin acylase family protein [Desulfobacteraceae bacterium]